MCDVLMSTSTCAGPQQMPLLCCSGHACTRCSVDDTKPDCLPVPSGDRTVEVENRVLLSCRGVGLVNVMGRQSGFIAMMASMASGIVDCCLIPEQKFDLDKLMAHIEAVIHLKGHCVICVAEGAGQVCMWTPPLRCLHRGVAAEGLRLSQLTTA